MLIMEEAEYKAVWVSHSSLSDFISCPRAYYLAHLYKNPLTGRKITLMKPPLALGQAVHATIDSIADLPIEKRFEVPLVERFKKTWKHVSGEKGGFKTEEEEKEYYERGIEMIKKIEKHPGPLAKKALKIDMETPHYWLSEKDNIILCGKIDWLEYVDADDSIHVIDFKSGKRDEKEDSLQLPIYYLLAKNCQSREVSKVSYWYVDREDSPREMALPEADKAYHDIMKVASRVKLARQLNHFVCPHGSAGCMMCAPYEAVLKGKGTFVGVGDFNKEVYVISEEAASL